MSSSKNHYQVLGVNSDVSAAEIKRAYRRLAKEQHPDAQVHNGNGDSHSATQEMMLINEAYSTLMDKDKRAEYDLKIGVRIAINIKKPIFTSVNEDAEREKFLRLVLHPVRSSLAKVLSAYNRELKELSADPYDDELVSGFEKYVDKIEAALRKGSDALMQTPTPRTLEASVLRMRQALSQAADGLDELRYYLGNYNYNHLTIAESLFKISTKLSLESLELTKTR